MHPSESELTPSIKLLSFFAITIVMVTRIGKPDLSNRPLSTTTLTAPLNSAAWVLVTSSQLGL